MNSQGLEDFEKAAEMIGGYVSQLRDRGIVNADWRAVKKSVAQAARHIAVAAAAEASRQSAFAAELEFPGQPGL